MQKKEGQGSPLHFAYIVGRIAACSFWAISPGTSLNPWVSFAWTFVFETTSSEVFPTTAQ